MPNSLPVSEYPLSTTTINQLANTSTASVATLLFKQGYGNVYIQGAN